MTSINNNITIGNWNYTQSKKPYIIAEIGVNHEGSLNLAKELKEHNKRSAGILLSGGSGFCSGALINNTANDGTPYFLTADHCYSNPANWAFRFGWISPDPVCATTANSTNGPTNMTLSGATLRARDLSLIHI